MRRHKVISAIAIIAAVVCLYFILNRKDTAATAVTYTYGTVQTGTIVQSVSGTGQIEASKQANINAEVAGKLVALAATAGQDVKAGDLIAKIDDHDGREAVEDAKIALYNAQVALDDIMEPADQLELDKAKNSVTQGEKTLESDKNDLEQSYEQGFNVVAETFNDLPGIVAGLQEIVTTASNFVVQSDSNYLEYYYNSVKNYDSSAAALLTKATLSYREAKAKYDTNFKNYKAASRFSDQKEIEALIDETYQTTRLLADAIKNVTNVIQNYEDNLKDRGMEPQSFAATQLSELSTYMSTNSANLSGLLSAGKAIDTAKDAIDKDSLSLEEYRQALEELQQGADETDVQSAKYTVQQKERALEDAQTTLGKYTITAPFDGAIASVDVDEGDDVSSGTAVASIMTDNQIVTVSLNEVDIAKVKAGQKATLTFDAISDLTMTGKVAEIASVGTVSSGVVNYDVTIALDAKNEQVKPGMSVAATIITDIAQDVLTVASGAVKTADDGSYYVLTVSGDNVDGAQATQQTVTTGLDDGTIIEIKSGLNDGDRIVVSSSKSSSGPSASGSSAGRPGGFFMGGMGAH